MSCLDCSGWTYRRYSHVKLGSLDPQLDRARVAAAVDPALARLRFESVELVVGMEWIVVEEDRTLGSGTAGEAERVGDGGVPPAKVVGVLLVGVLAVVDQQRCIFGEAEARNPLLLKRVKVGTERGLLVGNIGEGVFPIVDPVAERWAAVGDRGGTDARWSDLPLCLGGVAKRDVAGQLTHLYRGKRRRDVAGDAVAQGGLRRGRAPDHDLGLRAKAGGEEDEALDVVEAEVGEQNMKAGRLVGQGEAEVADAGARIECQQRAVGEGDADARGVTAVADRLWPWGGDRAARAPELRLHLRLRLR